MHLVIISGATRPQPKSNTAKIIAAFQKGFEENGNTTEVWYLSDRKQWENAKNAFESNEHIADQPGPHQSHEEIYRSHLILFEQCCRQAIEEMA